MQNHKVLDSLLTYLKKSNLLLDRIKFSDELKSHPQYPHLISVVDTLELFNISHSVYNVSLEEIDSQYEIFLALLSDEQQNIGLNLVERRKNVYKIDASYRSIESIRTNWGGIVLILDPNNKFRSILRSNQLKTLVLLIIGFILLVLSTDNLMIFFFYLNSLIGIYLSKIALRNIFDVGSGLLENVCAKSNCDSVIKSTKWRIFHFISFSDLSITFFSGQLLLLFLMTLSGEVIQFLVFQKVILLLSSPLIIISIYYQKVVERKWCPICLSITSVLSLEIIFISLTNKMNYTFNLGLLFCFLSIYVLVFLSWMTYKKTIAELKTVKEIKNKYDRFFNDYVVFKQNLTQGKKHQWSEDIIPQAAEEGRLRLTIVTDPFCYHCKVLHNKLSLLLADFKNEFCLNVIFNIDIFEESNQDQLLYRNMINLQITENNDLFTIAMSDWFGNKDETSWLERYERTLNEHQINIVLDRQKRWCSINDINYTPALFINGFLLPTIYNIDNLKYLIEQLILDSEY